ncbi:MAG: FAD-binding oxidoreductase [Caldilineae bacterium]|nr:MAG: FAD-binding oxidoreductase [Caldilineae bacterium]
MNMQQTFDVIVVGAGIMGCSTAYQLARRGLKVAVLEKGLVASGGSGKSSAIIRQHYSNELTARMALYSLRVFQHFDEVVGGECGFTETGFVALTSAHDRAGLEANVALQRRVGIRTEILGPEALLEVMPGLNTADLVAAAWEPESGYADPYLTVNSFAQAARREGAQIFQQTRVTGVRFAGGRVQGVDTTQGRFDAGVVVNATGAWGAQVAAMAGIEAPIKSCRVQVGFFRRPPGHEAPHPVVADFVHAVYYRSETGALTLAGLIDPSEAEAVVDPDDFDEQVEPGFVLEVGERIIARYPVMEQSESTGGYASLYAITPDWHPLVDEVPDGSGFYICAGFSGHGFKLGPAVGKMMADLVTGVEDPEFDPTMFRFTRFEENDPVRGQYEYSIVG